MRSHRRIRTKNSLNKWILLTFCISLIIIGSVAIYFAQWNVGYLILGWLTGYFADPIKSALESQWISYATEETSSAYDFLKRQQSYTDLTVGHTIAKSSNVQSSSEYTELEREALEYTVPISPNVAPPLSPPKPVSQNRHKLEPIAKRHLLQKTDNPIRNAACIHCEYAHPLLEQYPYDPRFHFRECQIPELRSLVDQVILCPQQLINNHYQEKE
ncbi:hypothetical protein ACQ4M3_29025 [Leptolyngbya sp. AN03gr2]|uniref:hypothetical protein n=1 Tax=unclassified Leptolyngbya TaxID=2650499 RepID=UPI003D30FA5D